MNLQRIAVEFLLEGKPFRVEQAAREDHFKVTSLGHLNPETWTRDREQVLDYCRHLLWHASDGKRADAVASPSEFFDLATLLVSVCP